MAESNPVINADSGAIPERVGEHNFANRKLRLEHKVCFERGVDYEHLHVRYRVCKIHFDKVISKVYGQKLSAQLTTSLCETEKGATEATPILGRRGRRLDETDGSIAGRVQTHLKRDTRALLSAVEGIS